MIAELMKAVDNRASNIRQGQALMNKLRELNLALYKEITDTSADCFYLDSNIPEFWKKMIGTLEENS